MAQSPHFDAVTGDQTATPPMGVREASAADDGACRDFCGLDALAASLVLRRPRDRGLLDKAGAGSRTHYLLAPSIPAAGVTPAQRALDTGAESPHGGGRAGRDAGHPPMPDPAACNPALATLLPELATWLATLLGKDRHNLRNKHLIPMVRDGQLRFRYPESAKHPHQAYVAPEAEDKNHV